MKIDKVKLVCFSPTGTTKDVLGGIAKGLGVDSVEEVDLTIPAIASTEISAVSNELVVIGAPVYAGRVAGEAVKRFRQLKGNNTPAVLVVVYGNREFEDALLELKNLAKDLGFVPVAGGAFIGEHSYATSEIEIANGRPDDLDLHKAEQFGGMVKDLVTEMKGMDSVVELTVPGNFPHRDGVGPMGFAPVVDLDKCTRCGECVTGCPTGTLAISEAVTANVETCIQCCSCIKKCPVGALSWQGDKISGIAHRLNANCQARKEPKLFGVG